MRNKNRISIVLDIFENNDKALSEFLGTNDNELIHNLYDNWDEIKLVWKEYPDLRFGQLLSSLRLISSMDIEDKIWNIEEDDWLIKNNYLNIEDIKFWGSKYDKDNNELEEVQFKLLKNLDLNHIENIIKWFKNQGALSQINKQYLEYFNKRLNDRK